MPAHSLKPLGASPAHDFDLRDFFAYTTHNVRRILGILMIVAGVGALFAFSASIALAAPVKDVGKLFTQVYGRAPTATELKYWEGRRNEKPVESELRGAMLHAKSRGNAAAGAAAGSLAGKVPQLFKHTFRRDPNDKEKRYWTDRVTCKDLATEKALTGALSFHKSKGVAVGSGTKEEFCARAKGEGSRSASRVGGLNESLGFSGHVMGPLVRIGLLEAKGKGIQVTGSGKYFLRLSDGTKKVFNGPEQTVTVSWGGNGYIVKGSGGYKTETDSAPRFAGMEGEPVVLASQKTKPSGVPGAGPYNRYRGILEVRVGDARDSLWAINEVRTEEYVRGLAETTDAAPPEFHKALSVLARTYVLYHHYNGGRQPHNGFTIRNNANDQLYAGLDYEARVPDFREQSISTKGQVVTYDGKPIAALYFSQSNGHTKSGEEVWRSKRFPYLQAKDDPYGGGAFAGHGTGMSARGAVGFARKDNWDYRKILTYYFTSVKLEKAY